MLDHPNSRGPFTEPGCLGWMCILAAPVLAGLFDVTGFGLLLSLIAVFVGVLVVGALFGTKRQG